MTSELSRSLLSNPGNGAGGTESSMKKAMQMKKSPRAFKNSTIDLSKTMKVLSAR